MNTDFTYYISDNGDINLINNNDGRTAYIEHNSPFAMRFQRFLRTGMSFDSIVDLINVPFSYTGKYSRFDKDGTMYVKSNGIEKEVKNYDYKDFIRNSIYQNYGKPFFNNLIKALDMLTMRSEPRIISDDDSSDSMFYKLKETTLNVETGGILVDSSNIGIFKKSTYSDTSLVDGWGKSLKSNSNGSVVYCYKVEDVRVFEEYANWGKYTFDLSVPCFANKNESFMELALSVKYLYNSFWKSNVDWDSNKNLEGISKNENIQVKFMGASKDIFKGIDKYMDYVIDCCITSPINLLELVCGVNDISIIHEEKEI